jgi:hypothetical protein
MVIVPSAVAIFWILKADHQPDPGRAAKALKKMAPNRTRVNNEAIVNFFIVSSKRNWVIDGLTITKKSACYYSKNGLTGVEETCFGLMAFLLIK